MSLPPLPRSVTPAIVEGWDKGGEQQLTDIFANYVDQHIKGTGYQIEDTIRPKFIDLAKSFIEEEILTKSIMMETLPDDFLKATGIATAQFTMKYTRYRTKILYTQQKYNLLREESEGFAKIITELSSFFVSDVQHVNVNELIHNMKSLIGYFALDPNRCVDLVIDAYQRKVDLAHLPHFFQLIDLFNSTTVCHILGFRMRHYQQSKSPTPPALFDVAAHLIKTDRINLAELYSHLSPSDDSLAAHRTDLVKQMLAQAQKLAAPSLADTNDPRAYDDATLAKKNENVLHASIPVLPTTISPSPPPSKDKDSKDQKDKADTSASYITPIIDPNQKYELLRALIDCDDWAHTSTLLEHLEPLMPASHSIIHQAMCRWAHRAIKHVYEPLAANAGYAVLAVAAKKAAAGINGAPPSTTYTEDELNPAIPYSPTPLPLSDDAYTAIADKIYPLLRHLSIYLSTDPILFTKLCRVIKQAVIVGIRRAKAAKQRDPNTYLSQSLEDVIAEILIPAFSMMPSASGPSMELWGVLQPLPYHLRYKLYGYWRDTIYDKYPELQLQRAFTNSRTKYFRKRIVAALVKEGGRQLATFSMNNPVLVFDMILQQVQLFDNMINPVVDILKYMPPLSFDILSFVLVDQLADPRAKLKSDGMNEQDWFQSLTKFAGNLYRKYPDIELAGLIQYVINELKDGKSLDLLVIKELLAQMTGIEAHEDISDAQMEGQMGDVTLQIETDSVRSLAGTRKKAKDFLINTLMRNNFILPLFVLMQQQKHVSIFESESHELRHIGELYDKLQGIITAFIEFIDSSISSDLIYAQHFPTLVELVNKYGIAPSSAFKVLRRCLHLSRVGPKPVSSPPSAPGASPQMSPMRSSSPSPPHDAMEVDEKASNPNSTSVITTTTSLAPIADGPSSTPIASSTTTTIVGASTGTTVRSPLVTTCLSLVPEETWRSISPEVYLRFWQHSMYHVQVPKTQYEAQMKKVRTAAAALETGPAENDKNRKRKTELIQTAAKLKEEMTKQIKESENVLQQMRNEKTTWFSNVQDHHTSASTFLQHCIMPRVMTSGVDALYAAKFVALMIRMKTPYFCALQFWNLSFRCVGPVIASCTSNEATRFGRYLCALMEEIHRLSSNDKVYAAESKSNPTLLMDPPPTAKPLEFAQLALIVDRWHEIVSKTIVKWLRASNKMDVGNALIIFSKIAHIHPRVMSHGISIEKAIQQVVDDPSNKHSALQVLGTRCLHLLQTSRKNWRLDVPDPKTAATSSTSSTTTSKATTSTSSSTSASSTTKPSTTSGSATARPSTSTSTAASTSSSSTTRPSTSTSSSAAASAKPSASAPNTARGTSSSSTSSTSSSSSSSTAPAKPSTSAASSSTARPSASASSTSAASTPSKAGTSSATSTSTSSASSSSTAKPSTSSTANGAKPATTSAPTSAAKPAGTSATSTSSSAASTSSTSSSTSSTSTKAPIRSSTAAATSTTSSSSTSSTSSTSSSTTSTSASTSTTTAPVRKVVSLTKRASATAPSPIAAGASASTSTSSTPIKQESSLNPKAPEFSPSKATTTTTKPTSTSTSSSSTSSSSTSSPSIKPELTINPSASSTSSSSTVSTPSSTRSRSRSKDREGKEKKKKNKDKDRDKEKKAKKAKKHKKDRSPSKDRDANGTDKDKSQDKDKTDKTSDKSTDKTSDKTEKKPDRHVSKRKREDDGKDGGSSAATPPERSSPSLHESDASRKRPRSGRDPSPDLGNGAKRYRSNSPPMSFPSEPRDSHQISVHMHRDRSSGRDRDGYSGGQPGQRYDRNDRDRDNRDRASPPYSSQQAPPQQNRGLPPRKPLRREFG